MSVIEKVKFVKGLAPAADRWNTDPATDIVSLALHKKAVFIVHQAGGTTGKATLTVEACDDVSASATTAIPFAYSVGGDGSGAGGDATGTLTQATAAGFDTTAGSDRLYIIEVDADTLPEGKPYLRLVCTEAVDDPVTGAVEIALFGGRYTGQSLDSAIA